MGAEIEENVGPALPQLLEKVANIALPSTNELGSSRPQAILLVSAVAAADECRKRLFVAGDMHTWLCSTTSRDSCRRVEVEVL